MDYENIIFTVEDGIATIKLNRPKALNALNSEEMRKYQNQRNEAESVSGRSCDRCFEALSDGLKNHVADNDCA